MSISDRTAKLSAPGRVVLGSFAAELLIVGPPAVEHRTVPDNGCLYPSSTLEGHPRRRRAGEPVSVLSSTVQLRLWSPQGVLCGPMLSHPPQPGQRRLSSVSHVLWTLCAASSSRTPELSGA